MIERAGGGAVLRKGRQAHALPPNKEHDERKAQDCVGITSAEFVSEPLGGSFQMLRLADKQDDLLECAFLDWTQHNPLPQHPIS